MRVNKELESMEQFKESFLKIRNENFEEEKYYTVTLDIRTDSDGDLYPVYNIPIKYSEFREVRDINIFGNWVTKNKLQWTSRLVRVYAIKDKDGIREMVTGLLLAPPCDEIEKLYCCGLMELSDFSSAGEDLKFINSYKHYREQYVEELLKISKNLHDKWERYSEQQKKEQETEESNIQYFKSYRKPQ